MSLLNNKRLKALRGTLFARGLVEQDEKVGKRKAYSLLKSYTGGCQCNDVEANKTVCLWCYYTSEVEGSAE